jgi:hypothetical protein
MATHSSGCIFTDCMQITSIKGFSWANAYRVWEANFLQERTAAVRKHAEVSVAKAKALIEGVVGHNLNPATVVALSDRITAQVTFGQASNEVFDLTPLKLPFEPGL